MSQLISDVTLFRGILLPKRLEIGCVTLDGSVQNGKVWIRGGEGEVNDPWSRPALQHCFLTEMIVPPGSWNDSLHPKFSVRDYSEGSAGRREEEHLAPADGGGPAMAGDIFAPGGGGPRGIKGPPPRRDARAPPRGRGAGAPAGLTRARRRARGAVPRGHFSR